MKKLFDELKDDPVFWEHFTIGGWLGTITALIIGLILALLLR